MGWPSPLSSSGSWAFINDCHSIIIFLFPFVDLALPLFPDVTVGEGELLMAECTMNNIPDITTFEIRDQYGMLVNAPLGVYTVPGVTRAYAGTYSCIVMSTLDNSTVNETSQVIVQCKLLLCTHIPACNYTQSRSYYNVICHNCALNFPIELA